MQVETPTESKRDEAQKAEEPQQINPSSDVVTLMIKNIPCGCDRAYVLNVIQALGFGDLHNFFHLPTRRARENFGYAFIGFPDAVTTQRFSQVMDGFVFTVGLSSKVVAVAPARIQGVTNRQKKNRSKRARAGTEGNGTVGQSLF